uniref:Uncharacterized protein n=1 Tax=Anguilla anguilla TaxID=7936 RepID=A0A0E9RKV1_ANGAN
MKWSGKFILLHFWQHNIMHVHEKDHGLYACLCNMSALSSGSPCLGPGGHSACW